MITLYSTGCPNCLTLEAKLNNAGIEYTLVSDIEEIKRKGYKSAPLLEVDGKILTFFQAVKYCNEHQH